MLGLTCNVKQSCIKIENQSAIRYDRGGGGAMPPLLLFFRATILRPVGPNHGGASLVSMLSPPSEFVDPDCYDSTFIFKCIPFMPI